MKRLILFFGLLSPLAAQNPPEPSPLPVPLLRVEVLVVRLPTPRALELQPELRDPTQAAAAQDKLLAMVKSKEAELIDWPVLTALANQRAVTQNLDEVRYATNYHAPRVVTLPSVNPASKIVKEPKADKTPSPPAENGGLTVVGGAPSDFQTVQHGVTLEADMHLTDDERTVEAQIKVQHVALTGFRQEKLVVNQKYSVVAEHPEFQTRKTDTSIRVPLNQVYLLAFHQLKKPEKMVELFVLKFSRVDSPQPTVPPKPAPKSGNGHP